MIYDFLARKNNKQENVGNDSEDENQSSPGVLNDSQPGQFATTVEEIVELPIASIRPCRNIPDYRDLTESPHPIVIHSPDACQCIDGWNLIEKAQADGRSSVRCHVFKIDRHSEIELAIRKVAIRTKPLKDQLHVFLCLDNTEFCREYYGQPFMYRLHFMQRLCERAKVTRFGFHAVRHLSASILFKLGYEVGVMQAILRHKSPNTTERYLKSIGLERVREALEDLKPADAKVLEFNPSKKMLPGIV